jgi:hypothetical protein
MTTPDLMAQIELNASENQKLIEFSLNLALQEDDRFDEGRSPLEKTLWYLHSMEPEDVKNIPLFPAIHTHRREQPRYARISGYV